jgi:catechol 2,3-dioxygenase-like lactoylglutathione lyase family enzyme
MWLDRITRRDALFVLGAATVPQARAQEGLLRVTRVDHVGLAVGDIDKAMMFYRRLFGNEVLKDSRTPRRYLRLGPCYMAIAPAAAGEAKRVDHFAVGIEDFNAASMRRALENAGLRVRESNVGLFVLDPDGTSVQIWADHSWNQLSNAAPEAGPRQETLFHPRGMHHVAIQVTDMALATSFYRKLFGEPAPGQGNPPQPTFKAGETRILLYNPALSKPAKIDHFSVLVDNFEAASALKVVKSLGANAELSKQGTLNEFFDPDGIRLQVTFPGQTYGGTTKK